MKYLLIISCLVLMGCSTPPKDPQELTKRSITFHDPSGTWPRFKGTFLFDSQFIFSDNNLERLEVGVDVAADFAEYKNLRRNVTTLMQGDSCYSLTPETDCNGYKWTKNFYTFVWGLPMKLQDPGIQIPSQYRSEMYNGELVYAFDVAYPTEDWTFYFNQEEYNLIGFRFVKNDGSGKGEFIYLEKPTQINEIHWMSHRKWFDLDSNLLGTNQLVEIKPLTAEF